MSHIFKTWVTPTLHEAGFKKRGIVYVRDLGSIQHLFNSKTKKRYSSKPEKFLARFSCDDD